MDYAQARMQARFGERPDESLWQAMVGATQVESALKIARSSSLARWIAGLDAASDGHTIELALRARWRECVAELASWLPPRWQAAMLWTSMLPDLPALMHLARGGAPLDWMRRDPLLQPYALADDETRIVRLRNEALAFAAPHWEAIIRSKKSDDTNDVRLLAAWRDEWRRRWPRWGDREGFEALARWIDIHLRRPIAGDREDALRRLRKLFREVALHPAAAFVYLAFIALDLSHLRSVLLRWTLIERPLQEGTTA